MKADTLAKIAAGAALSTEEAATFALIAAGLPDKVIAHLRGVCQATVTWDGQKLRRKLGVATRTQLALAWYGMGEDDFARAKAEGLALAGGKGRK